MALPCTDASEVTSPSDNVLEEYLQQLLVTSANDVSNYELACQPGPFRCDVCGKLFVHDSDVTKHTRDMHDGAKTFECYICGKTFVRKVAIVEHQHTHSGVPQQDSATSKRAFKTLEDLNSRKQCTPNADGLDKSHLFDRRYESNLDVNEYKVKKNNDAKPFNCDVCLKRFTRKSGLHNHLKASKTCS